MNLEKFRKERGISQTEIAKVTGVTQAAVSLWERGERFPRMNVLGKISLFYDISIQEAFDLFYQKGAPHASPTPIHRNRGNRQPAKRQRPRGAADNEGL